MPHQFSQPDLFIITTKYRLNPTSSKLIDLLGLQAKVLSNQSIFIRQSTANNSNIISLRTRSAFGHNKPH